MNVIIDFFKEYSQYAWPIIIISASAYDHIKKAFFTDHKKRKVIRIHK